MYVQSSFSHPGSTRGPKVCLHLACPAVSFTLVVLKICALGGSNGAPVSLVLGLRSSKLGQYVPLTWPTLSGIEISIEVGIECRSTLYRFKC